MIKGILLAVACVIVLAWTGVLYSAFCTGSHRTEFTDEEWEILSEWYARVTGILSYVTIGFLLLSVGFYIGGIF